MTVYYVDFTATGTSTGANWANAIDNWTDFDTLLESTVSAGDSIYMMGGQTYTSTSTLATVIDGTQNLPIKLIGVASGTTAEPPTVSDWVTGSDRPLIACGANAFRLDDYWWMVNLRGTITEATGFRADVGSYAYNCDFRNTSGTAGRIALSMPSANLIVNNQLQSDNGSAIETSTTLARVHSNYIKGSAIGAKFSNSSIFTFNIFYDCVVGLDGTISDDVYMLGNVFDNCTDGFTASSTEAPGTIINCSFSNCTNGLKLDYSSTNKLNWFLDYNNWYNNTRDISVDNGSTEDNSMKGIHDTAVNPNFTAAASDDFTLTTGSALRNAGMPLLHGVG